MWTRRPTNLIAVQVSKGASHIIALDAGTNRACHLKPTYDVRISRDGEKLRIWVATSDADVDRAISLIKKEHAKPSRRRGTFLCMAGVGDEASDKLIGAAILDGFLHGNPIERDVLARPVLGNDWRERLRIGKLTRAQIVHRLGLVCGTRFAVRRDRQGKGLGDILAHHSAVVAACWRWPVADNVEVVRWIAGHLSN
jgi:hypothetical protein